MSWQKKEIDYSKQKDKEFTFFYCFIPNSEDMYRAKTKSDILIQTLIANKDKRISHLDIEALLIYQLVVPNLTGLLFFAAGYFLTKKLIAKPLKP